MKAFRKIPQTLKRVFKFSKSNLSLIKKRLSNLISTKNKKKSLKSPGFGRLTVKSFKRLSFLRRFQFSLLHRNIGKRFKNTPIYVRSEFFHRKALRFGRFKYSPRVENFRKNFRQVFSLQVKKKFKSRFEKTFPSSIKRIERIYESRFALPESPSPEIAAYCVPKNVVVKKKFLRFSKKFRFFRPPRHVRKRKVRIIKFWFRRKKRKIFRRRIRKFRRFQRRLVRFVKRWTKFTRKARNQKQFITRRLKSQRFESIRLNNSRENLRKIRLFPSRVRTGRYSTKAILLGHKNPITLRVIKTYNNFFVSLQLNNGRNMFTYSTGRVDLRRNRRLTKQALEIVVRKFSRTLKRYKLAKINLRIVGQATYHSRIFLKALKAEKIQLSAIRFILNSPHNGLRVRASRRV